MIEGKGHRNINMLIQYLFTPGYYVFYKTLKLIV